MSYVDQVQDPRRRATAIASVAAVHAAIAIGLVAGLTVTGVAPQIDTWDPFELTPDPIPKAPPPEPSPAQAAQESLVVVPPPLLPPHRPMENTVVNPPAVSADTTLVIVETSVVGPTPAPLEPALFKPTKPRPSNNPLHWLSNDDYPARALRTEAEGVAAYRLIVGTTGRASACEITRSTGNRWLDDATCKFIIRRARFEPATDQTGAKIIGSYAGTVNWQIPD